MKMTGILSFGPRATWIFPSWLCMAEASTTKWLGPLLLWLQAGGWPLPSQLDRSWSPKVQKSYPTRTRTCGTRGGCICMHLQPCTPENRKALRFYRLWFGCWKQLHSSPKMYIPKNFNSGDPQTAKLCVFSLQNGGLESPSFGVLSLSKSARDATKSGNCWETSTKRWQCGQARAGSLSYKFEPFNMFGVPSGNLT